MSADTEAHPATLKFLLAVPKVTQSISPALSALHVTRTRLIHHAKAGGSRTFDTTHCTKCGMYLLAGHGSVRVARKQLSRKHGKTQQHVRVLRKSCLVCGEVQDVPVEGGDPPAFAKVGKKKALHISASKLVPDAVSAPLPQPSQGDNTARNTESRSSTIVAETRPSLPAKQTIQAQPSPSQSTDPSGLRNKARAKKKSGLSDMLARNKERQQKERTAGTSRGLAAFLQDL
ncbi:hypothetical protein BDW22DRAFT_512299 [Trametopsis cervina]|nr:hypothetical protein BDW22DRAFT_512299 [Trametopsis cervina]